MGAKEWKDLKAELFKPYEKHHSTVKDACQTAEKLDIKNLILWHTEDKNISKRQALYLDGCWFAVNCFYYI